MNTETIIAGLENLRAHCESMHDEEGDQWGDDAVVLTEAIRLIALQKTSTNMEGKSK